MYKSNKKITRIFGILALTALFAGAADAQARPGSHRHDRHGDILAQIELSETQSEQIDAIRQQTRELVRQVFQNDALSREEKHDAIKTIHRESKAAIQALLTDEQRAQIEQLKADRQAERIARKIQQLTDRLELNDDQVAAITLILNNAQQSKQAIRDADIEREEKREQVQALKTQVKTDILALLTDEQAEVFNRMRTRRNHRGRRGRRGGGRRENRS